MAFDAATFEIDPQSLTTPRARLEYMRDFLRRLPAERFDLVEPGSWDDAETGTCGSPACIGGWARALFRFTVDRWRAHPTRYRQMSLVALGEALFELPQPDAHALFFPVLEGMTYGDVTPSKAATVIDHLLNTGKVDWSVARTAEA